MAEEALLSLTNPQINIYMREQFYKGTSINNVSFSFYFAKELDEKICTKAINKIIEKNDGLRLRFKTVNNEIKQYLQDYTYEDIPVKTYKNKTNEETEAEINHDAQIPFIFENSKLYKFAIYKLKDNKTVIFVKLHHIICDAWTGKLCIDEFIKYYKAFSKNDEESKKILEENKPSYINYIETEKKYLQSNKFQKDKAYWEENVENLPEAISFKEIVTKKTSNSKRYSKEINLSDKINQYCKKNNISAFAFFVAVYSIYLYKTQSKEDFIIGTPLLNRKNKNEKETFGVFVSTVPIKIHIEDEQTIGQLCKNISKQMFGALRHESYPYVELQNYVYSKNKENANLYDTIISFQNAIVDSKQIENGFGIKWHYSGNQQTSFEFHITDHNDTGKYTISLDYNENYCDDDEIVYVYNRMINIIKQIINEKQANTSVKTIDLIDENEKKMVVKKFNFHKKYEPNKTLISLFENSVKKYPNNVAIKYNDIQLTYQELEDRVNTFATYLREKGVKGNIPVCILLERSLDMVIAMLGVLKAGGYYVTIDPFWPDDRVSYIMDNIKSNYVITQSKYKEKHPNKTNIIVEDIDYTETHENVSTDIKMTDYAYVIYTSGSTGKPKGTMMTNININNLLNSTYQNFKQNEKDIWTLFHTYTFDFSAWEIYGCLTQGGKLIIVPKNITTDPKKMLNLVLKEKVTILNQTPAYFYKVLDQEKLQEKRFTNLRLVILGGEAVVAEPIKYWKEKYPNIPIYNGYGPTETTIFAIMGEITKKDIEKNNILLGTPLENYHITILNKHDEILGIGLEGEICITGKSVCDGYFNNKEMTASRFINTPDGTLYKTGDVGYWTIDGRIKYIGRNDNQVKIRGFRVELEEIEKELLKCEGVSKAVVFPIENSNFTKSLVGFIEAEEKNCTDRVLDEIRKNLTSYMIPKLYQINTMPLNDNGKVDRRKLVELIKEREEKRAITMPRTKIEKEIYDIISKEKNITNISITDDFFQDIGLDSLDIMKLSTSLSEYNVEIQKINNNPTIEKLAYAISNKQKDTQFINKLYDANVIDKKFKYNLSTTFLTGATGFLGIHLLKELIFNRRVKKIYCLVRGKGEETAENRIENALKNYFQNYKPSWLKKVVTIEGDFEKEFLGLEEEKYKELCDNITTIIHCGANVKHFGNYASFYKTNVVGTENIIKLAYDANAKLAHISTISVGGFSKVGSTNVLTEKNISINQEFKNHVYMITKYEAECKVLDAIGKEWIQAKIFRLGNIMPRLHDGVFQKNKYDNGFLARMQTILGTKTMPEELCNIEIDLSPVDLCSKCIVRLMMYSTPRTILHIFNKNTIKINQIFKKSNIKVTAKEDMINKIKQRDNPYDGHLLNDLLNADYIETPVINKLSSKEFIKIGFRWNRINDQYIDKIMKILHETREE